MTFTKADKVRNYIDGTWRESAASELIEVFNPATGEVLARTPISPKDEVDQAASAAASAFQDWRRVPATERIQYLFRAVPCFCNCKMQKPLTLRID